MARLPRKLQNGEQFKASTVYTINEIIAYLESVRLSGDKRTIRLQEHATGITISAIAPPGARSVSGGPATCAEYNGYFKIIDSSTVDENGVKTNRISIVDGATYDASTQTSGKSICKVNNAVFEVDMYSAKVTHSSIQRIYYLRYSMGQKASGGNPEVPAKVDILTDSSLPADSDGYAYYQLGRVFLRPTDQNMQIQQDHVTGVPVIWWYLLC